MSQETFVRKATPADATAIADLRRAQWAERDADVDDEALVDRMTTWLFDTGMRTHWLAIDAEELVGIVSLTEFERMPVPGSAHARWGYIGNFFVLADRRSRGLGRQLLDAAIAHSRERGHRRIVLSPSERSKPLYARAGFGAADILRVLPLEDGS